MEPFDTSRYWEQLETKRSQVETLFAELGLPAHETFASPPLHFRMRAEFRIWHQGDHSHYAMTPKGGGRPEPIDRFDIGSEPMVAVMPSLLEAINQDQILRRKLYACEFLTTSTGEVLVTLIYHRPLDDHWRDSARLLAKNLGIDVIGRSRKQKVVITKDFVTEKLQVAGRTFRYQQVETGFSQPNARVNEAMLAWAADATTGSRGDLLELYCGNGNFTVVLSGNYNKVLATEVSKVSVASARHNFQLNGVNNVAIARMSSEELTQALNGDREFNRLRQIDLPSYDFSTVFVDPPRAGLDEDTLALVSRFDTILYISCNPMTLKNNISSLASSHQIERFALFDQFPWTEHIECGALLTAKAR